MSKLLPLKANGHLVTDESKVRVFEDDGGPPMVMNVSYSCGNCGEAPTYFVAKGVLYAKDPCPYPDGITTTVTLEVPSGKLIVTDNLSPLYDYDDTDMVSYNTRLGQAQAIWAMAAVGCAYGPVGNSCPGLYRTGPDSYIIARPEYDDDDNPSLPEADRLASIITDLWAYSVADYLDWMNRGGDPSKLGWTRTVVDVKPGTYQFTHHVGENSFDRDAPGTVVFAHIERIS